MQDNATAHIGKQVNKLISAHLGDDHVISRNFPNAWPPRSLEWNPSDFWLWGFLQYRFHGERMRTLKE